MASVYCNVSQAICDLIKISREQIMNLICESNFGGLLGSDEATFRMDQDDGRTQRAAGKSLGIPDLVKSSILEDIERYPSY